MGEISELDWLAGFNKKRPCKPIFISYSY